MIISESELVTFLRQWVLLVRGKTGPRYSSINSLQVGVRVVCVGGFARRNLATLILGVCDQGATRGSASELGAPVNTLANLYG